jgi:hypothetical protein
MGNNLPTTIGLYYPFIHFKNEAWLKLAALYWDKMGRIVPTGYKTHDSETVKQLAGELGFIENFAPHLNTIGLAEKFLKLLREHGKELRARYAVSLRDTWRDAIYTQTAAPPGSDSKLAYVFNEKMWPALQDALVETGLAVAGRIGDPRWIGMHPRLHNVYIAALAEEMAAIGNLHPTTDETVDHVALSGVTLERLAQALLGDVRLVGQTATEQEVESQMSLISLQFVIPKNINSVPAKKIIAVRKKHRGALAAFQNYIHKVVSEQGALLKIKDPAALRAHLEAEYEKTLKPQLDDLRKRLNKLQIDATWGAFNVKASVPPLVVSGAAALGLGVNPILAAAGGLAIGLIPVIRDKQKQAEEAMHASPATFLMRVEEDLNPGTLIAQVRTAVRDFVLGV